MEDNQSRRGDADSTEQNQPTTRRSGRIQQQQSNSAPSPSSPSQGGGIASRLRSRRRSTRQQSHHDEGEEDDGGASSGDDSSTTEEIQDEQEAKVNDNAPLEKLTSVKLKKKCEELGLKTSGQKNELIARIQRKLNIVPNDGNDNNYSPAGVGYNYTTDHNGNDLWPKDRQNPSIKAEEYVRRMRIIGENNLSLDSPDAEWNAAFPGTPKGESIKRWYRCLRDQTIVTTEEEFYLHTIQYCGLSGRQIGERIREYNNYCMRKFGRTFPIPCEGSEAWRAMYEGRQYDAYRLARAVHEVKKGAQRNSNANKYVVARALFQILKNQYSLVDTRTEGRGSGRQYLESLNISIPDYMADYPDVEQSKENVLSVRNSTYAVESKSSDLMARLQSQMIKKAAAVADAMESLPNSEFNLGYSEVIDIHRTMGCVCPDCPTPLPLSGEDDALIDQLLHNLCLSKHCLTLDHNRMIAMWIKHKLFGGVGPNEESYDNLVATSVMCDGITSLALQLQLQLQKDNELTVWNMDWTSFMNELPRACQTIIADDEIDGMCSFDVRCMEDHNIKDCSRKGKNNRIREINFDITDGLKLSIGKCAFTGRPFCKDDLAAVSAHHPCRDSPLYLVRDSSSDVVLVDMKKESQIGSIHIGVDARLRKGEIEQKAREFAVTQPVGENPHHIWHNKIENGRIDIGKHPYNVKDGVVVVNADDQQEFGEIIQLCGEVIEVLHIEVRKANGKAVSIAPLHFDASKLPKNHQSFAKQLYKMSKADLDSLIEKLKTNCHAALIETEEQVKIDVGKVNLAILDEVLRESICEADNDSSSVSKQSPSSLIEPTTAPIDSNDTNNPPSALASASTSTTPATTHPSIIPAADGYVVLISSEGEPFQLERSIAVKFSPFIASAIKGESSATGVIRCRHIRTATLELFVKICKRLESHPVTVFESALESCYISDLVDRWYVGFLASFDRNQFYHLMMAAKILGVKPLFDLLCATIACAINGKTPDEVRQILTPNDDTPFVTVETDDSHYAYKWELGRSGGYQSKNLGKSSLRRKTKMSTRRDVDQESILRRKELDDESESAAPKKRKKTVGPKRMKKPRKIVIDQNNTELSNEHMKDMLRYTSDIILDDEQKEEVEEEDPEYARLSRVLNILPMERLLARPCLGDDGGLAPELHELWARNTCKLSGPPGTRLPFRMRSSSRRAKLNDSLEEEMEHSYAGLSLGPRTGDDHMEEGQQLVQGLQSSDSEELPMYEITLQSDSDDVSKLDYPPLEEQQQQLDYGYEQSDDTDGDRMEEEQQSDSEEFSIHEITLQADSDSVSVLDESLEVEEEEEQQQLEHGYEQNDDETGGQLDDEQRLEQERLEDEQQLELERKLGKRRLKVTEALVRDATRALGGPLRRHRRGRRF